MICLTSFISLILLVFNQTYCLRAEITYGHSLYTHPGPSQHHPHLDCNNCLIVHLMVGCDWITRAWEEGGVSYHPELQFGWWKYLSEWERKIECRGKREENHPFSLFSSARKSNAIALSSYKSDPSPSTTHATFQWCLYL